MWTRETWTRILAWLRKLRMARQAALRARRQSYTVKPQLEGLAERIVPTNLACTFVGPVGGGVGAWNNPADWTTMPDDSGTDTATIAAGATCVLDQSTDVKIAGLTVNGDLTTQSGITVAPGGTLGNGTTSVASGGLLTVAAPDLSGVNSTLDTSTLTTAAGGSADNLVLNSGADLDVDSSGKLMGSTSIGGLFTAKNINANSGAFVTLGGTGTIAGNGQLNAEAQATFDFGTGSTWTIGAGSPAGSALEAGNFVVDGTLALNTDIQPYGDITLDPGGTIGGTATLTVGQKLTWLGGTLTPAGGTEILGELNTTGSTGTSTLTLGSNLESDTLTDTLAGAGTLFISSGATFTDSTGQVDLSLPTISSSSGGTGSFVVAAGATLNALAPSSSPTVITSNFTNDGDLTVDSGDGLTLSNSGGVTTALNGTMVLDGDLTLLGSVSSPLGFLLDAGGGNLVVGNGTATGTLTIPASEKATLSGGTLEVSGTGTLTGAGEVDNSSGTLKLDDGSTTGFADYVQSASGTLALQAAGAGVFSRLGVTGDATLAGALSEDFLNGYTPTSGTVFPVLTAGSISNQFNTTPPNMTASYGSTSVTLTQD